MAISFIVAINRYFGKKPGQGLADFAKEIRALTPTDKEEMRGMLAKELGEDITPAQVSPL